MTDILPRYGSQIDMGFEKSPRNTPLIGGGDVSPVIKGEDTWFKVSCNAGIFVVKATHPVWAEHHLKEGLQTNMGNRVTHGAETTATTMQQVLGLPDVDPLTIEVNELEGIMAKHYTAINQEPVVYLGSPEPS